MSQAPTPTITKDTRSTRLCEEDSERSTQGTSSRRGVEAKREPKGPQREGNRVPEVVEVSTPRSVVTRGDVEEGTRRGRPERSGGQTFFTEEGRQVAVVTGRVRLGDHSKNSGVPTQRCSEDFPKRRN